MSDIKTAPVRGAEAVRAHLKSFGHALVSGNGYRPDTKLTRYIHNFAINNGGLGDYINYMSAFQFMASEYPQIKGRIFVKQPFLDVAQYILRDYPEWKVYDTEVAPKIIKEGELLHNPGQWHRYLNATGAHLMDLGWKYFLGLDAPLPGWDRLPDLTDYVSGKEWNLPLRYAVVTPGYTSPARAIPAKGFNAICSHLLSKGIVPVFLGKENFAEAADPNLKHPDYYMKMQEGIDLTRGINLINQTTLLESVEIMRDALLVIGVDNGLLHFAGCTEVPIIFGHTVTTIQDRIIRRPKGTTYNISPDVEEVPCAGCQSKMRANVGHDFKYCFYKDYACLDNLFKDDAYKWTSAVNLLLRLSNQDIPSQLHLNHPPN